MRFKVGDLVKIDVPLDDDISAPLVKFNGFITTVTKAKPLWAFQGVGTAQIIYECKYCESIYGIPYSLIGEWLYGLKNDESE